MTIGLEKAVSIAVRSLTPNKPYHVQWMLTRKCNYRCRSCYVWRGQDARELSTEKVKRGLDVLRRLGVIEVVLSGGNPLLRNDIHEILEYASRYFVTTVYDNGSMAVDKINALRNSDFVAISIDSLDPKKNDYIRGVSGAWRTAMKAIEHLRKEGIRVGVAPTISQFNLHEMLDFTKYFLNKDMPVWYSLYSYDPPSGPNNLFNIGRKDDEFAITDRNTMVRLCDSLMAIKKRYSNVFMTTKLLKAIRTLYLTGERCWKCRALQNFFMIDNIGRVAGCHIHDPVTSLFELPRAWNSPKLQSFRRMYRNCRDCTYLCYVFYSLHGSVVGNIRIAEDQWKNARLLVGKKSVKPQLARQQQRALSY